MSLLLALKRWPAPLATGSLWALAAGGAVFWALRLATPAPAPPAPALPAVPVAAIDAEAVARLFGAVPSAAPTRALADTRHQFTLQGVAADGEQRGAALISIDGQAPRPYRVGAAVGDAHTLSAVGVRSATLAPLSGGGDNMTLQVPVPNLVDLSAGARSGVGVATPPTAVIARPRPPLAPLPPRFDPGRPAPIQRIGPPPLPPR
ncbi:MAG: type II secretion system protein N [Variovorax sp.]